MRFLQSANTCRSSDGVAAPVHASEFARKPRREAPEVSAPLHGRSSSGHCPSSSPLWPREVTRRWDCHHHRQAQDVGLPSAVVMEGSSPLRDLRSKEWALLGVNHVVGQTLGSHAYRIGGVGAWVVTSIPVGTILLSGLRRVCRFVGL